MTDEARQLADDLRELMRIGGLPTMRRAFAKSGAKIQASAVRNARTRLKVRTGNLSRSISVEALPGGPDELEMVLRASTAYAGIQDEGGTVSAASGRMLRIPLPPALTAGGVDRFQGKLRVMAPDLFHVIRSGSGSLLLMNSETGEPWYVLKRSVRVPRTKFLTDAVDNELAALGEAMSDTLAVMVEGTRDA